MQITEEQIKKYFDRVKVNNTCWEYPIRNAKGYAVTWLKVKNKQRKFVVSRLIASNRFGYDPFHKELIICHKCDNPACINPDHLFIGTQLDNQTDAKNKGRKARGVRHFNSCLSKADVIKIIRLWNSGYSITSIAAQLNRWRNTVQAVVDKKSYIEESKNIDITRNKRPVFRPVKDIETGKVFQSMRDAAKHYSIDPRRVSDLINNKRYSKKLGISLVLV